MVTFHRLDENRTRVMVQLDFVPEGIKEKVGDALGAPERKLESDLASFKDLIERRGEAAGSWRGEVSRPDQGS